MAFCRWRLPGCARSPYRQMSKFDCKTSFSYWRLSPLQVAKIASHWLKIKEKPAHAVLFQKSCIKIQLFDSACLCFIDECEEGKKINTRFD